MAYGDVKCGERPFLLRFNDVTAAVVGFYRNGDGVDFLPVGDFVHHPENRREKGFFFIG